MNEVGAGISKLIESGILGVLLVLAGAAIVYLYRAKETESKGRLQDQKEVTTKIVAPIEAIQRLLESQIEQTKKDKDDILDAVDNPKPRRR